MAGLAHTAAMKQLQEGEVLDCENTKISLQNYDSAMTDVLTTSPQLDRNFLVDRDNPRVIEWKCPNPILTQAVLKRPNPRSAKEVTGSVPTGFHFVPRHF